MVEQQRWFRRHPKKAVALLAIGLGLATDLGAGWLVIPRDHGFRCPHPVYHHGLQPNRSDSTLWGRQGDRHYPMVTNSLGFRDRSPRSIRKQPAGQRLLILGDSFAEGVGVRFEDTFAGLLEDALAPRGIEVLNAAVVSYSPKLYYLKARHLLETEGLRFDSLLVFIDISDIQNELSYRSFEPREIDNWKLWQFEARRWGRQHSLTWHLLGSLGGETQNAAQAPTDQGADLFPCLAETDAATLADPLFQDTASLWTIKPAVFEKYGRQGLILAVENMEKLAALCKQARIKLTVAIYPWPQQIQTRQLENMQVKAWRDFAQRHGAGFIDLFPRFIDERAYQAVRAKYFIPGDVHWNEAGHQRVAETVLRYLK